jgi:hypothetical protein
MAGKKKKPKWREENGRMIAVLENSAAEQSRLRRLGQREAELAAAKLGRRLSGAGYHGGGERAETRRDRREANTRIRQGRYED